ncbi:amino-acid N-acetyltransferase [Actinomycetospora sp. CA-084318]|uniref:amino-acid N-acetyltransferase n=1 Tax=Actinomycetospora sp. CA-084318 TaxID=3239892 RepID=UPI003D958277
MSSSLSSPVLLRRARTADVRGIKALVDSFADDNILLRKPLVTLYETVQEFRVAVRGRDVIGCGALHVLWENLGEIRTIAVHPSTQGGGVGHTLVEELIAQARALGLASLFVLTFEVPFFERLGFREIEGSPVSQEIYLEMMQSADEGVAEFLDLAYVKPNTLGNTRMLLDL